MATVDFSNAKIEFIESYKEGLPYDTAYIYNYDLYDNGFGTPLGVNSNSFAASLHTYNLDSIANVGKAEITNTPTKWVCNYAGTFTKSGNKIYIAIAYTQGIMMWGILKITNISFSEGDDFDFDIEIDYSGS